MAVAADGDLGLWPMLSDAANEPAQMTSDFGARGCLAGAQEHGDGPARLRVVDVDRQETALAIMGVELVRLSFMAGAALRLATPLPSFSISSPH
jgi:hypothetical protein